MTTTPGWLLAIDTATTTIVVAAGTRDGAVVATDAFEGRYRHSQELLPAIIRMVGAANLRLPELAGVVVGTGPGAFTGLRVGIATAKTLAHELGCPIVGISSAEALLAAVGGKAVLWLPSGPRDRVVVHPGRAPLVLAGEAAAPPVPPGFVEIAVDLEGRAPTTALSLGRKAVEGLGAALLALGAARLAAGDADDAERLVPRYASAPRGAQDRPSEAGEGVAWSRDPR